jgi:hypothetical protein
MKVDQVIAGRNDQFKIVPKMRGALVRLLAPPIILGSAMIASSLAQTVIPAPRLAQPTDSGNLIILKGNVHPAARPETDRGTAPVDLPLLHMVLVLKPNATQRAALSKLLDDQQNSHSPAFHKWLTPSEFGERFGVADQGIEKVSMWLRSYGFTVESVSHGHTFITFSGTNAQLQQAFHTQIHRYLVQGKQHYANASNPEIPAGLADVVAGIASLHDFHSHPMHKLLGTVKRAHGTNQWKDLSPVHTNPQPGPQSNPMFTTSINGNTFYAMTPYDFAVIYNLGSLWNAGIDGSGQSIAIVARSDIQPTDVDNFRASFGLPATKLNILYGGDDPGLTLDGDEVEADLDVQWSGAIAKEATIDLVISASTATTDGALLSAIYAVDNNVAPVMSMSFGECELGLGDAGNQTFEQLWQQAAAQGISVMVAAGDGGSAACDQGAQYASYGLTVSGMASTPYTVAVGGTDFYGNYTDAAAYWSSTNNADSASALSYVPEIPWNNSCASPQILAAVQAQGSSDATTEALCNDPNYEYTFLDTSGGGGGQSNCLTSDGATTASCAGAYPKPAWQSGITGIPSDGVRDLPDISLFAGSGVWGSFYVVCDSDESPDGTCNFNNSEDLEYLAGGGTSFASPSFAGILALVNQKTGTAQGVADYTLYKLGNTQYGASNNSPCRAANVAAGNSCLFYDITTGTNAVVCASGTTDCNPTNPNDSFAVLPSWNANAGYDLATGLGSVNAYNLVEAWPSAASSFLASQTTLTLNSSSATYGSPISGTITVAPTSSETGTPSGEVTLKAATGSSTALGGMGVYTLANGQVAFQAHSLPAGTYPLSAQYGGDATFSISTSTPVQVTITPASTTTTMTSSLSTLVSTQSTTFSVIVGTQGEGAAPTGSVVFTDQTSGATLGTVTVMPVANSSGSSAAKAALNIPASQFAFGANHVLASYSGDGNYAASASSAITITSQPMFSVGVSPSSLTISASGSQNGTAIITIAPTSGSLATSISLACGGPLPAGTACSFSPSTIAAGSSTTTSTLSIQLTSPLLIQRPGSTLRTRRIAWYGSAGLSGFAAIMILAFPRRRRSNQISSARVFGVILFAAVMSITMVGGMACGGSNSRNTGTGGSSATSTTVTASSPNVALGSPVSFTAAVSASGSSTPTGTVTFTDGTSAIDTATLTNGQVTFADSSLAIGTHSVTGTYNGDSTHSPSTSAAVAENVTFSSTIDIIATDATGNVIVAPLTITVQ